jgi:drug/metabolite transporter (DMT)-like permease
VASLLPVTSPFPYAGEAAALLSSVLWAAAGIVFRRLKGRVAPAAMNLAKNGTAALCFAVLLLGLTGNPWPQGLSPRATAYLAASGVLGLTICDTYFLRSILELGPRRATLIMAGLAPGLVFAAALLPPFRQVDKAAHVLPWVGFALAIGGVWLASREVPDGPPADPAATRRGWRDGILAAVFQAAGVLLTRLAIEEGAAPFEGAAVRLTSGTVGLLAMGLVAGRLSTWRTTLTSPGILRTLAVTAFFGTFLGIGLNTCALAWADSTGVATTINSLSPVWLIPLSAVFLAERHGLRAWLSTVLALVGIACLAA